MSKRPKPAALVDPLGCMWQPEKLRELLSDPEVSDCVQTLFRDSHDAERRFSTGRCYALAQKRYRREESAALLFLLVVYHRDHTRPWPRTP